MANLGLEDTIVNSYHNNRLIPSTTYLHTHTYINSKALGLLS